MIPQTTFHKEVKSVPFQGKTITVENLTPVLSPRARDRRKRRLKSACLMCLASTRRAGPPSPDPATSLLPGAVSGII